MLILQPVKVAVPAFAASGLAVHVRTPAFGFVPNARVIEAVLPVTVLPPASCTITWGWVAKATPKTELLGCCVKPSCAAGPTVIANGLLTADVNEPSVAVSVYVPATFTLHPANVETPATAARGFVVQASVAPPGDVNANVTLLASELTVLPPASRIATCG